MPERIYEVTFATADYLSMDTWICRGALAADGVSPAHIDILIALKTLHANTINTADGVSIAALVVEPTLAILKNALKQKAVPDKICVPDTFVRSQPFVQKASEIHQRICKGEPFHLVITVPSNPRKAVGHVGDKAQLGEPVLG